MRGESTLQEPPLTYYLSEEARQAELAFRPPRPGDAGFDIQCLGRRVIPPRGFALLPTGLYLAVPLQWVAIIKDRSSIALRGGCVTAGVIDASYRGEVKVAMHNLSEEPLEFENGDRIAQCVIVPHLTGSALAAADSLEQLGASTRGHGGFGSTGR